MVTSPSVPPLAATMTAARWTVTRRAFADSSGSASSSPCSRAKPAGSRSAARARVKWLLAAPPPSSQCMDGRTTSAAAAARSATDMPFSQ